MIKRFTILFIVLTILLLPLQLAAQSTLDEVETVTIEFWPDYDDTAVLVLLTGFFPPNTSYPATLTIPLPENADINAVAHITEENLLTDQGIEYAIEGNQLTFTTPSPGFRIEFYVPYTTNGSERNFSYTWQSETAVNNMSLLVQQPIAATDLTTIPNATSTTAGNDGLTYHTLPNQILSANEPFTVNVSYTMNTPELTASLLSRTNDTAVTTNTQSTTSTPVSTNSTINWPLILAGIGFLLLIIAGGWQLATKRTSHKPRKPQKRQPSSATKAKFCHQCGSPIQAKDKFCRQCGTAVKKS